MGDFYGANGILAKVLDRAAEVQEMFRQWSRVLKNAREAELRYEAPKLERHKQIQTLDPEGQAGLAIMPKSLETCSAKNLEPQLEFHVNWITERVDYLRERLKEEKSP